MKFDKEALLEFEALDKRLLSQMEEFKDTRLDAMYRFSIGEMTWQEQIDEASRVLTINNIFPDMEAKSPILDKHFKSVKFKY